MVTPPDLPPLPETDDPFTLLGVTAAEANNLGLRRAYVRLIKVYRPERSPDAFQRIRAAYEDAQEQLSFRCRLETVAIEDGENDGDRAAAALRRGDSAAAFASARLVCQSTPSHADGWWIASRALVASGGAHVDAHAWLLRGLRAGAPLAARLLAELPAPERDQFVAHPDLSWPILARQSERNAALELMRCRVEELLCHDQLGQAIAEVSDPAFARASVAEPELESIVLQVVAVAAWDEPSAAAALYTPLQTTAANGWVARLLHEHIGRATHLSEQLPSSSHMPAELRRLLTVMPVVDNRRRARCVRDAAHAAAMATPGWLIALDALDEGEADLLVLLRDLLDDDDDSEEDDEAVEDMIDEVLSDLSAVNAPDTRRLAQVMREIDRLIGATRINSLQSVAMGLALFALIPAIRLLHWWAIGYAAIAFVAVGVLISKLDGRLYRAVVRPPLADEVTQHGTRTLALVGWIKMHAKWTKNVGRFDREITDDAALHMLCRLARLAREVD